MDGLTQEVMDVAQSLMVALDCPRSLTVAILLRYGDADQLTSLEVDPMHYLTSNDYVKAVSATDFLRKYEEFTIPGLDVEAATVEKWWWAERECYKTNERLSPLLFAGPMGSGYGEAIDNFVDSIRKAVVSLIGDRPDSHFDGRFGPGATVSDMSRYVTVPDKMSSLPTLTPGAKYFLLPWMGTEWYKAHASSGSSASFVHGNVFFTVPKTARTRRACAKEPSINGFYQLGLGRMMKARLKRSGLDLEGGQGIHRQVACEASQTSAFATIDLSSASDTVCTNLVKLVLPHRWHSVLDSLRSPYTLIEGKRVKLEKFSSMGNGYTFELETTIFAAIAIAAMRGSALPGKNLFVYGDDIIVPSEFSDDVVSALKFFGFTPNKRKTFKEGNFRESCGGDYFQGDSVRACYLKKDPNEPQKLISLANGIRRLAAQGSFTPNDRGRLLRAWFRCLDLLPSDVRRCRGPEALGDIVIHDTEDKWDTRWRNGRNIRYIRVYRPARYKRVRWSGFNARVQLAAALYLDQYENSSFRWVSRRQPDFSLTPSGKARSDEDILRMTSSWEEKNRYLVPRDGVVGFKVGWVPFS